MLAWTYDRTTSDSLSTTQSTPEEVPNAAVGGLATRTGAILPSCRILSLWDPLLHALEAVVGFLVIAVLQFVVWALLCHDCCLHVSAVVPAQEACVSTSSKATVPFNAHGKGVICEVTVSGRVERAWVTW